MVVRDRGIERGKTVIGVGVLASCVLFSFLFLFGGLICYSFCCHGWWCSDLGVVWVWLRLVFVKLLVVVV